MGAGAFAGTKVGTSRGTGCSEVTGDCLYAFAGAFTGREADAFTGTKADAFTGTEADAFV